MTRAPWFRIWRSRWCWWPVALQGWLLCLTAVVIGVAIFLWADAGSHSIGDTLLRAALPWIALGAILQAIVEDTGAFRS